MHQNLFQVADLHIAFQSAGSPVSPINIHPEEVQLISEEWSFGRKKTFIMGRMAAGKALSKCCKDRLPVKRGLMNEPLWPESYTGSISHKENVAVAAVGSKRFFRGIGIDIEEMTIELTEKELSLFCCQREIKSILQHRISPIEVFSIKETFLKACFGAFGECPEWKDIDSVALLTGMHNDCELFRQRRGNYIICLCLFKNIKYE